MSSKNLHHLSLMAKTTQWSSLPLREFSSHHSREQHRPMWSLTLPICNLPQNIQYVPQRATSNLSRPLAQLRRRNQQHRRRIDQAKQAVHRSRLGKNNNRLSHGCYHADHLQGEAVLAVMKLTDCFRSIQTQVMTQLSHGRMTIDEFEHSTTAFLLVNSTFLLS